MRRAHGAKTHRACYDHFARFKDKGSGFRVAQADSHRGKALRIVPVPAGQKAQRNNADNTEGFALGVAHLHSDTLEVNARSKVNGRHHVL